MGAHLIGNEFQSDKYPTTPRGKVPLSVRDPSAQDLLWTYAQRRRAVDAEFSDDLEAALRIAGYEPMATGDLARAEAVKSATVDGAETSAVSSERERHLRSALREQVAYYLQEDLEGGELFKETWEACRDPQDREVVRDELRALLRWLRRSLLRGGETEGRGQTP